MPQPYLKPIVEVVVLRSPIFRDDNFNPVPGASGSNWTKDAGVTVSTEGDILTLSGTTAANGITRSGLSISTDTYPKLVVRGRSADATTRNLDVLITFSVGSQTITITLTNKFQLFSLALTAAKTVNSLKFLNQSVAGSMLLDLNAICKADPVKLHENDLINVTVTRATSSVDEFSLSLNNKDGVNLNKLGFPSASTDRTHRIYIWMGYLADDTITRSIDSVVPRTRVFGGTLEELTPSLSKSGDILNVHGRGWGAALLKVLVTKEYGIQSDNGTITQLTEMERDIVTAIINASGNGYQLTTAYLQAGAPTHNYLLFKNEKAFDAIKHIIDVLTAGGNNTQFWVDPSENVHQAPIANWGADPNSVTYPNALNVGRDQIINDLRKDSEHTFNQVRYIGQLFKPPNRDYYTETVPIGDWGFVTTGAGGTTSKAYDGSAGNFKVNSQSVKGTWSGQTTGSGQVDLRYPEALNLALDVTKLGGKISPPVIRAFVKSDQTPWAVQFRMQTSGTAEFLGDPMPIPQQSFTAADWQLIEYRIGPYGDRFVAVGGPSWSNINRIDIGFQYTTLKTAGNVWVDGLYIAGQVGFIQKDSTRIAQYDLSEVPVTDNTVREETAHRDLGLAELKRLRNPVLRGTIRVPGIPDVLPGQRVTITAPSANLSAATLRVLEVRHSYSKSGFTTELDLTDDLTNYQSLSPIALAKLLTTQDMPGFRKKEEQDIFMQELDPTITFTAIDNPS